jgi:hypothetical protein
MPMLGSDGGTLPNAPIAAAHHAQRVLLADTSAGTAGFADSAATACALDDRGGVPAVERRLATAHVGAVPARVQS